AGGGRLRGSAQGGGWADLGGHHRQPDGPPRQTAVSQKISLDLVAFFRQPQAVVNDVDQISRDNRPIEPMHRMILCCFRVIRRKLSKSEHVRSVQYRARKQAAVLSVSRLLTRAVLYQCSKVACFDLVCALPSLVSSMPIARTTHPPRFLPMSMIWERRKLDCLRYLY